MLHQLQVEWPCLSFDLLRDNLGNGRTVFPMTAYLVAGSQAEKAKDNKIYIMKMSDLHRTKHDDDDEADDNDEDLDDDPILESRTIPHMGGVNRIRVMPHPEAHVVSTWSENGKVYIWDVSQHVAALDTPGLIPPKDVKPIYSVERHGRTEGFAMDWSELGSGRRLLTGDFSSKIYLTDLQWSPKEEPVFASCSADKTIRIWDITFEAHDCDVNVISWNRITDYLIASGCDSGAFSVWDLRSSSALVVAGADHQVTIWDLALERDPEEEAVMAGRGGETVEVPPQFEDVKEVHWHQQMPGVLVSTAFGV
ncbi:WD40-repeat-containing domain protein [Chytridium lagenaria]|nr:WD40-repeat-containing domain protein [Chytridium lagenaria]